MYINKSNVSTILLRLFLAVIFVTVIPAQSVFAEITKGPLLLRVYQNRVALVWESDSKGPGKVSYGKGQKIEKHIVTNPERIEYEIQQHKKPASKKTVFIHKTWIEQLSAGQTYSYRVADSKTESKTYTFRTIPADTNEISFIVYGDSRSNPAVHRKLVQRMMEYNVDFVVNSGDLVLRGWNYKLWSPQFFEPLKGLAESVPIYAIKGNHDRSEQGYYEKLLVPPGGKNNFAFDYGPLHYFCTDNITKGIKPEEVLGEIITDAQTSKGQWKFVSYHVPSVNFGRHWSRWGQPDALAILAGAGVDFVITGHSHQYERFRPIAPPPGINGSYVTHITSGGGGANLYNIEQTDYHVSTAKAYHFCLFRIKANTLTMDTIDIDGKIIDHMEISKIDGKLNKEYLQTAMPIQTVQLHQDLYYAKARTIPGKPEKDKPFSVVYQVSLPASAGSSQMTFELRCHKGLYKLPESKKLTVPKDGGFINVELTVVPLVNITIPADARRRLKPITPPLWLDCHYEVDGIQRKVSLPVVTRSKKPKQQ